MEDSGELSFTELRGLTRCFGCKMECLFSPVLSMVDPTTNKGMDEVDYISLDYADGTRYVVRDDINGLDNTDYGLISGERPDRDLRLVFNRLVDPSQVVSVTVDGHRYEVTQ